MTLKEIVTLLDCRVITGEDQLDRAYSYAFSSDLMSDVLAFVEHDILLLTGLVNMQVIRTSFMLDLKAIVFIRGKIPGDDVVKLARQHDMVLLSTRHTMYMASGILYKNNLAGAKIESRDEAWKTQ